MKNSTWCSLCVECFVRISEQTATFALYVINWLDFITVVESVSARYGLIPYTKQIRLSYLKGWAHESLFAMIEQVQMPHKLYAGL